MTEVYFNRNNTQGQYTSPLNSDGFRTTNHVWQQRAAKPLANDDFHKQSLRYGQKHDYQPKFVGARWTLKDSTGMVKKQNNEDMKMEKNARAALSNWKAFNSYERVDQQKVSKDRMANEVGNIQATLALARA